MGKSASCVRPGGKLGTHTQKKINKKNRGGSFHKQNIDSWRGETGKTVCFGLGKLGTGSVQPLTAFTL